jgi:spore germination protein YaaH
MQAAGDQVAKAAVGAQKPFTPVTRTSVGGAGGPRREVFGFALASSLADTSLGYPSWQFQLLSTVAFFGLHISDNGSIAADSGLTVWNSSQLTGLLSTAHQYGTKVVVAIVLQDFSPGTPHMCSGLANRAITVSQVVAQVKAKGVDGVNIDYEGLGGTCQNGYQARAMMADFARQMRGALPAGSYLSIDTYASSAIDPIGFFDIANINKYVDSFFVMAYDLEYSNYHHSPHGCSTFCLGPTAPLTGYYYNDTNTASQYASAVTPGKVILGVPYYGRKGCVSSATPNAIPTSQVVADMYLDASGESGAPNVKLGSFAWHRDGNDPAGQERWDTWFNTSLNCTRELYWDDIVSLADKYALVNQDNLRGAGIWTLNYAGGVPEVWSLLDTYFACNTQIATAASSSTTEFSVSLSSGRCTTSYFEVQDYDATLKQGNFRLGNAPVTGGTASMKVQGFPGHTYNVFARAHSTGGATGPWASVQVAVSPSATYSHPWKALYTVDAFGGLYTDGSPQLAVSAYWGPSSTIGRVGHALPGAPDSGAVLDGYGGLHPYGAAMTIKASAYWAGWNIARDFAFLPDRSGGYVLDGYGGLHPFSINGKPLPAATAIDSYWPGWDIARRVVIFSDGTGGYVLDGWGGIHPFGINGKPRPSAVSAGYWPHWDIIHDLALIPGTHSGYQMDGFGGIHPFAPVGQAKPPSLKASAYWANWDIARGLVILGGSTLTTPGGYVLDGYGGLHQFGSAPAPPAFSYWPGRDIARNIAGY